MQKPGIYKLEVFQRHFYFEPVIVEINENDQDSSSKKKYSAYLFTLQNGSKGQRLIYPLHLEPSHKVKYFDIEEPFNPLAYL